GLQAILERYLTGSVFDPVDIAEAAELLGPHFADTSIFNAAGFKALLEAYDGALPLRIKALPEGLVARPGVPLFTVQSTDVKFAWLAAYFEGLLQHVWYPTTVASQGRAIRTAILR